MNTVVMQLTRRSLLGRRRAALLMLLPALLLVISLLWAWRSGGNPSDASGLMQDFGLGTVLPLICLLIGTGAIGPEIEDQSIVYLLAKPVKRLSIVLSKLVVAYGAAFAFGVLPIMVSTWIAGGGDMTLTWAMGAASALASLTYVTVFFTLAILTRNAVIVGLLYALLWETVLGGYAPGVRALSVRQWSLASAEQIVGAESAAAWGIASEVSLVAGLIAIVLTILAAIALSARKLSRLQLRSGD